MRNASVGPWAESAAVEIQPCPSRGRQGLELGFTEPTCRGSFIQSFPLGWKGRRKYKEACCRHPGAISHPRLQVPLLCWHHLSH